MAEKLCQRIENENIEHLYNEKYNKLTVSIGVCTLIKHNEKVKIKEILQFADHALYEAKHSGKNAVRYKLI